jgi:hypothetical protein
MLGKVDGNAKGGDGVLCLVSLVPDLDRVAEPLDADLVDPDLAVVRLALSVT